MDLLFSYKGGDKNMDNVLLYFSLKHEGDFKKIYESNLRNVLCPNKSKKS